MDYRALASAQLTAVVLSGGIAIYLAFSGVSMRGLVAMHVANSLEYVAAKNSPSSFLPRSAMLAGDACGSFFGC